MERVSFLLDKALMRLVQFQGTPGSERLQEAGNHIVSALEEIRLFVEEDGAYTAHEAGADAVPTDANAYWPRDPHRWESEHTLF